MVRRKVSPQAAPDTSNNAATMNTNEILATFFIFFLPPSLLVLYFRRAFRKGNAQLSGKSPGSFFPRFAEELKKGGFAELVLDPGKNSRARRNPHPTFAGRVGAPPVNPMKFNHERLSLSMRFKDIFCLQTRECA
jgi:hypothetical protein